MAKGERVGGRQRGTPNKATAVVKAIAQAYTQEAIDGLVKVLRSRKAPAAARVMAARELLDRGHGKSVQAHTGQDGGPIQTQTTVVHHYIEEELPTAEDVRGILRPNRER